MRPKIRGAREIALGARGGGLTLMFAGDKPGNAVYGEIPIPAPVGTYKISTSPYQGKHGSLLIVRLER
jgi:hypothetical protein